MTAMPPSRAPAPVASKAAARHSAQAQNMLDGLDLDVRDFDAAAGYAAAGLTDATCALGLSFGVEPALHWPFSRVRRRSPRIVRGHGCRGISFGSM